MHYYQFNIADYRKDTTHLSIVEHGIYRQLMDWQYLDENPIPKETQTVMRRLCLGSEYETQLQNVLEDFFVLTEKGYVQQRIIDTIKGYHGKAETNKENGKLGGRPRKQGAKTQSVIFANRNETETKPNQKATNKLNNSLTNKLSNINTALTRPELVSEDVWADFEKLRKAKKAPLTKTALSGIQTEADKAGISLEAALVMACNRGWTSFKADWIQGNARVDNKADIARQTVPSSGEHEKTRESIAKTFDGAKPPSKEQLALLASIRGTK